MPEQSGSQPARGETARPRCFFADREDAAACEGRLQRAHLIAKQRIRHEFPRGAVWSGECWEPIERGRAPADFPDRRTRSVDALVWDERAWEWTCELHHHRLDIARTLRIARREVPPDLEEYAVELGMVWALDREYGELVT